MVFHLMYRIHFLLLLCSFVKTSAIKVPVNNGTDKMFNSISSCIVQIFKHEFKYQLSTTVISNETSSFNEELFGSLLRKFNSEELPVTIYSENNLYVFDNEAGQLIIQHYESCSELRLYSDKFLEKIKYLMIIEKYSETDCDDAFDKSKENLLKYDITFFLIDETGKKHELVLFVQQYDTEKCEISENIDYTTVNECHNGSLLTNTTFPDKKLKDLNKCPIKLGMASLYPFSVIPNVTSLKTYDKIEAISGSDLEIMKIVAEYFNATLDLRFIYREEKNPFIVQDFVEFLKNSSLDFCAGSLYRIYGNVTEYSGIYNRQAVIWAYSIDRDIRNWKNFIKNINAVYIFIVFYISYSIIWCVFRKFDKDSISVSEVFLNSFGALIGAAAIEEPRTLKQKILNLFYLLMCLYLSVYISIQLYSYLTIQKPAQTYTTNDDFMNSGKMPYLNRKTKNILQDPKYLSFANTSKDCSSFTDCHKQVMERKGATVTIDGLFFPFQVNTAVNYEAKVMRVTENIVTVYHEMLIRKDSPLVKKFQIVTQRLFEAGICDQLYYEAIGITIIVKAESANQNALANSYSCQVGCAITLTQAVGAFYLWIAGSCLSCVIFFLEIFLKKETQFNTIS